MCGEREEAKCAEEFGDNLDWTCANCPKARPDELHPYTRKLLGILDLREAGYPLHRDDLTLEEWMDLARVSRMVRAHQDTMRMAAWQLATATA